MMDIKSGPGPLVAPEEVFRCKYSRAYSTQLSKAIQFCPKCPDVDGEIR